MAWPVLTLWGFAFWAAIPGIFTLLAERYERRSTAITSNLVFSEWDRIFKNKMATSAAIDRLVHHSVVLEFAVPSYRTAKAKGRSKG